MIKYLKPSFKLSGHGALDKKHQLFYRLANDKTYDDAYLTDMTHNLMKRREGTDVFKFCKDG